MLALLPLASPALANRQYQAAKRAFAKGVAKMDKRKYKEAAKAFERSLSLRESKAVLFNLGVCYDKLSRPLKTIVTLERFLALSKPRKDTTVKLARSMLAAAKKQVARIKLSTTRGCKTYHNNTRLNPPPPRMYVLPGRHTFELRCPKFLPATEVITAAYGQTISLVLKPEQPITALLKVRTPNVPANISIDGVVEGQGEIERRLTPGTYEVLAQAEGWQPQKATVTLAPGAETAIDLKLKPEQPTTALLKVRTPDVSANISIDGVLAGQGQIERRLTPGTYEVLAQAEGWQPQKTTVTLTSGAETAIDLKLDKESSVLKSWWFWTLVATGVAAVAAGSAVALTRNDPCSGGGELGWCARTLTAR